MNNFERKIASKNYFCRNHLTHIHLDRIVLEMHLDELELEPTKARLETQRVM